MYPDPDIIHVHVVYPDPDIIHVHVVYPDPDIIHVHVDDRDVDPLTGQKEICRNNIIQIPSMHSNIDCRAIPIIINIWMALHANIHIDYLEMIMSYNRKLSYYSQPCVLRLPQKYSHHETLRPLSKRARLIIKHAGSS